MKEGEMENKNNYLARQWNKFRKCFYSSLLTSLIIFFWSPFYLVLIKSMQTNLKDDIFFFMGLWRLERVGWRWIITHQLPALLGTIGLWDRLPSVSCWRHVTHRRFCASWVHSFQSHKWIPQGPTNLVVVDQLPSFFSGYPRLRSLKIDLGRSQNWLVVAPVLCHIKD